MDGIIDSIDMRWSKLWELVTGRAHDPVRGTVGWLDGVWLAGTVLSEWGSEL